MDRLYWTSYALVANERVVSQQSGVRLYDGDRKSGYDGGRCTLTNLRIIWQDVSYNDQVMALQLSHALQLESTPSSFSHSAKISIHLSAAPPDKPSGPVRCSAFAFIQLGFLDGGMNKFLKALQEVLKNREWEKSAGLGVGPGGVGKDRPLRAGIVGIERNIEKRQKETEANISKAFEDLNQLMVFAKDMVALSNNIAKKITDRQGSISEDETVQFKAYLLSLGVENPVTRATHGSGTTYHKELAKELCRVLVEPIRELGGTMALADVYCYVNRARGVQLISPDDLLNSCRLFAQLKLPLSLRTFDSGVVVVQLTSHSDERVVGEVEQLVAKSGNLSASGLAATIGISLVLAKERLLLAERHNVICRDESIQGLVFYPNLFVSMDT